MSFQNEYQLNKHDCDIEILYNEVLKVKSLEFEKNSQNLKSIISKELLSEENDKLKINYTLSVTHSLFLYLSKIINIPFPENLENIEEIIDKIEDFLRNQDIKLGVTELSKNIRKLFWKYFSDKKDICFKEYFLSLNKKNIGRDVFQIAMILPEILPILNISVNCFYEIICHFSNEPKGNWVYNEVLVATKEYSKNTDKGLELLNYVLNKLDVQDNLIANIIIGLYEINPDLGYNKALELLSDKKYEAESILSLANFNYQSIEHFNYTFTIVTACNLKEQKSLVYFIKYLIRSIKNSLSNYCIKQTCFTLLKELAIQDKEIQNFILWEFHWLKGYDREKMDIISLMDLKNEGLYHELNMVLDDFQDIDCFFQIIKKIILKIGTSFQNKIDKLHCIDAIQHKFPQEFSRGLIKLLIDNIGIIRFGANSILRNQFLHHQKFNFQVDILSYNKEIQYRLIASLLGLYSKPEESLALVLPLRNSNELVMDNIMIQDILKYKIEELIDNYGKTVLSVLEDNLDLSKSEEVTYLEYFKSYDEELNKQFQVKLTIKELNPQFTQALLLQDFNKKFYKKNAETISKAQEEHQQNSWMQFTTKVIIGRGKKWKSSQNENVSQLAEISVSSQFPSNYFIYPEKYDWDATIEINQNW